jgi:hypothetical protein
MAKLILTKEINTGIIFFTVNAPQVGEKMLFLNPKDVKQTVSGYVSERTDSEGNVTTLTRANGLCVLLSDGQTLRPYLLSMTSITAQSAEPVEGTFYPQLRHKVTNAIGRQGETAVDDLCNSRSVVDVSALYPIKVNHRGEKKGTYNWTTIGLDPSESKYTVKGGTITFDKATITIEEIDRFFEEQNERQNARL